MLGTRAAVLDALRSTIATLEKRPALAGQATTPARNSGLPLAAPGQLHEVFAEAPRDAGVALGFALGLARGLLTAARPALLIVQLTQDAADMGAPYGAGFLDFGIDPDAVALVRTQAITELLWAIEEAVGCPAVAAVIADVGRPHRALDFTASRRLSLRTAAGGSSVFVLRYGTAREATAAHLRWSVAPARSGEAMFDPRAPTGPRISAVLEKGRLPRGLFSGKAPHDLDWSKDGFVIVGKGDGEEDGPGRPAALPRPAPAALGHRLSQAR